MISSTEWFESRRSIVAVWAFEMTDRCVGASISICQGTHHYSPSGKRARAGPQQAGSHLERNVGNQVAADIAHADVAGKNAANKDVAASRALLASGGGWPESPSRCLTRGPRARAAPRRPRGPGAPVSAPDRRPLCPGAMSGGCFCYPPSLSLSLLLQKRPLRREPRDLR
jgi:hypothetical protein